MAQRIYLTAPELERLRDLVEQASGGRDDGAAERLAAELDRAIVVAPEQLPADVVRLGSHVRFADERTGTVRDLVVVHPSAANVSAGRVSVLAPIGAALIGLRIGDEIDWPLPDGRTAELRILSVTPPAGSDERVTAA